ncbi:MAG: cadherin domain-containing protein, partial [Chlorobium sp.]
GVFYRLNRQDEPSSLNLGYDTTKATCIVTWDENTGISTGAVLSSNLSTWSFIPNQPTAGHLSLVGYSTTRISGSSDVMLATISFTLAGSTGSGISMDQTTYLQLDDTAVPLGTLPELNPPTVLTFNPVDASIGFPVASNIVVTFTEAIQKGTGLVEIHSGSASGALVESFDAATSLNLSVSGSVLTINPTANLTNDTHYFVTFAAGTVKDLAGNSYSGTTTYDFTTAPPVNDFAPVLSVDNANVSLAENAVAGEIAGALAHAIDADGNTVVYSLVNVPVNSSSVPLFSIDSSTGQISLTAAGAAAIDFESSTKSYALTVKASDGLPAHDQTATVTVNLTNVNDNSPIWSVDNASSVSLAENAAASVISGAIVHATDADGNTVTYSLVNVPVNSSSAPLFSIDSATGQISLTAAGAAVIDYESSTKSYALTVKASDGLTAHDQAATVTVNLTNVNDNSPVLTVANASVSFPENASAGAMSGAVAHAIDADGGTLTFSLVNPPTDGSDNPILAIDATTGQISLTAAGAAVIDFEDTANNSGTLIVKVSDGLTAHDQTATIALSLSNVNDNPPVFTSGATGSVAENAAAISTVIYTAATTDADNLAARTYTLGGTDAALLNIDASTGEVTLKASADYEVKPSYSFDVLANDGANSTPQAVVVSVTNVNDPHTGAATISGQPAVGATLTADITTLADQDGLTKIGYQWQASGQDITGATNNTLVLGDTQKDLPITVKVTYTDSFGNNTVTSAEKVWNQAPVIDVDHSTVSLAENAAAGELGVQATATDVEKDVVTLGLVSPNDSNDHPLFTMDSATGKISLTPAGAAALDYETHTNYLLTVTASDDAHTGASATTKTVTVNITDVNEAPTAVTLNNATTSIAENTSTTVHIKVADIVITDDALVKNNAVTLSGADANSFEVVDTELYLKAGETLNYEAKHSYALTVNVADSTVTGSTPVTTNYALTVTDVNEAPTAVALNNTTTSIAENTSTTTHIKVADIVITDDAIGANAVTLSGADANSFEAVGNVLYLKAGETLNYEAKNSYAVTVNVADSTVTGSSAVTGSYTLAVTNVNDAPTGSVTITGTATQGQTLTAHTSTLADEDGLGAITLQWKADGVTIAGTSGNTLLLGAAQTGKVITVQASYVDDHGTAEHVSSAATAAVVGTQSGSVQDGYLSNALVWVDSNANGVRDWTDANSNGTWDSGEGESWALTDATGQFTGLIGAGTIRITANPANPSGTIDISTGKAFTGSYSAPSGSTVVNPLTTLVVAAIAAGGSENTVKTALGLDSSVNLSTYDPLAEANKTGATSTALATAIKVQSAATQVANIMDIAASVATGAGAPSTTGVASSVATALMASGTTVNLADSSVISSAITTAATNAGGNTTGLTTVINAVAASSAAVNNQIADVSTAAANTANAGGTVLADTSLKQVVAAQIVAQETVASEAKTAATANSTTGLTITSSTVGAATTTAASQVQTIFTNHAPTGDVTMTGIATQGQTLTAHNTLADTDGLGTIHYQWQADGTDISGATSGTLVLGDAQVGHQVKVVASYTDGAGKLESVNSNPATILIQHAPTGGVTITGTVANGNILTVSNTLADVDGLGTISYQWYVNNQAIANAITTTWLASNVLAGDAISVKASYTDGHGTGESVSSDAVHKLATSSNDLKTELASYISSFSTNTVDKSNVESGIVAYFNWLQSQSVTSVPVVSKDYSAQPAGAFTINSAGHEALNIALPDHSSLTLDNADFAIISGDNVTVDGGAGNNMIYAGNGYQHIVLGLGDDTIHGGAGDDYVGCDVLRGLGYC